MARLTKYMRDKGDDAYLDAEELGMEEEFNEEDMVQWDPLIWENRDLENYSTVAVIPGCVVFQEECENTIDEFAKTLGCKHPILIIGTATTRPNVEEQDHPLPESGGRHDFFFSFHNLDIMRVAVPRLAFGVRWWEDVVDNEWNNLPMTLKSEYRENSIYADYVFDSIGFGSGVYDED